MKSIFGIAILIAVLTCWVNSPAQQVPVFSQNSEVIIRWIPPPDEDVVKFTAYFISEGNDNVVSLQIAQWNVVTDSCSVIYEMPLGIGTWRLYMTATDQVGNESEPSDSFLFSVQDAPPGKPLQVMMILKRKT